MASAAIQPASTEQVVQIVELANKHKMPISPVSIGRVGHLHLTTSASKKVLTELA